MSPQLLSRHDSLVQGAPSHLNLSPLLSWTSPSRWSPPKASICVSRTVCSVAGTTNADRTWVPPSKSLSLCVTGTNLDVPQGHCPTPPVHTLGLPMWETRQADGAGTDFPSDTDIPKVQLAPVSPTKYKPLCILDPILVSFPATGNGYYYCWFLTSVPSYRHRKLRPRDRLVPRRTAKCYQSWNSNPSFRTLKSHVLSMMPHHLPTVGQDSEALRGLEVSPWGRL